MGQTDRDVGGERDTVTPQTAGKKKKKQNFLDSWKLDPMQSRTGEPDLALDDSRLVPAPGWARAMMHTDSGYLVHEGEHVDHLAHDH